MRRRFAILIVLLMILVSRQEVFAYGGPAPQTFYGSSTPITTITDYTVTCNSVTITGHSPSSYVNLYETTTTQSIVVNVPVSGGTYGGTISFAAQPAGTLVTFYAWGATSPVTSGAGYYDYLGYQGVLDLPCSAPAQGITWFNPGDGRIDGQPGDRIAVWCNTTATPPNIVVYGVGDNATNGSHGFWLATFNNADLLKAGKAGITKNAGAGNGTISAMQDGNGNFYVAWNGGIFKATGQGDFAKSFSCQF